MLHSNKKKVINDPVYGFITIPTGLIYDIINHPVFQRLRRIKQLGLTDLIYPGANHTRFHHALGAMHLMSITLDSLKNKGCEISEREYEAALLAILLHDIGHGPFSHALEHTLLREVHHESLSQMFMHSLNKEFKGKLDMAIQIFENSYSRPFFHQLVSSQLDIDRLDYLNRDSFFTGVQEGVIGAERIIKLLNVVNDELVMEEKGIYSVENFLTARRLMYWQVYLHKTTISAEQMLIQIIRRAKFLIQNGQELFGSDALKFFFKNNFTIKDFESNPKCIEAFCLLDDYDVWGAIKVWQGNDDRILSLLSKQLLDRKLFKVSLSNQPYDESYILQIREQVKEKYHLQDDELQYIFMHGMLSNAAYVSTDDNINIFTKKGAIIDIAEASDLPNISALSKIVRKYYLCLPKNVYL